jgi:hypothetical protein
MFEKCAVAGDITKAIDRRGCWSVAITVIGGTESTAVKLQSCETADGVFTDYKELIPASEASADQYKGFVLDLYGAGKFIKVVGATMATAVLGDCDHDVKQIPITTGDIPSGADLENNKTATIDVSTYTEPVEITPTAGKDGMKKATVSLSNMPAGANMLYAWQGSGNDIMWTNFETAPATLSDEKYLNIILSGMYITSITPIVLATEEEVEYSKISDTSFSAFGITYTRNSTKDVEVW